MRVSFLLFFVFCCLSSMTLSAQHKIVFSDQDWQEVMDQAQKEDKLIFLDAYTSWCQACKEMDRTTFNSVRLSQELNRSCINVKMDMEKGQGPVLGFRYGINIFPGLLFMTSTGTLIIDTNGYQNADQMLGLLAAAKNPERQFTAMAARYDSGDRHPDFLYRYLMILKSRKDMQVAAVTAEYFEASLDWTEGRTMDLIIEETISTQSAYFDFIIAHRSAFNERFTSAFIDGFVEDLVQTALYKRSPALSLSESEMLIQKVYPEDGQDRADAFAIKYHLDRGDKAAFADRTIAYVNRINTKDPDVLNDLAWKFYEHVDDKADLETALDWAKKSVRLQNSYYNHDTLAALYYKLGNKRKAKKAAKKAIKLAKKVKQDVPNTVVLLAKIKAM